MNDEDRQAFVRDSDGFGLRLYKNGAPVGGQHTLGAPADPIFASNLMVGNYGFLNDPGACEFNGDIDEIRIYNESLPASAIKSNFDSVVNACNRPMLVPSLGLHGLSALVVSLATAGLYVNWRRHSSSTSSRGSPWRP